MDDSNSQKFVSSYFSHSQIIKITLILRVCERLISSPAISILSTLGARGFFSRSEAAIVSRDRDSAEREKVFFFLSRQDHDRGFAAHNRSFATKKKPLAPRVHLC